MREHELFEFQKPDGHNEAQDASFDRFKSYSEISDLIRDALPDKV